MKKENDNRTEMSRRGFLKGLRAKCKFVEPQKLLYSSSCGQWVPGSGS